MYQIVFSIGFSTKLNNFSFPYGLSANVNSLQGKFLHLEQTVANTRNLCFIALQETKLQNFEKEWDNEFPQHRVTDDALNIDGYYLFRLDRQFSANGGGLITYIAKNWSISNPKICCSISTPDIELIAVRSRPRFLPSDISNITLINVYIRPTSNVSIADKTLKSSITNLQKENPRTYFIIIGDVNRDRIDILETMGFRNLVDYTTYQRSNSTLDAVYVKGDYYATRRLYPISTSDHFSILITPKYSEHHRSSVKPKSKVNRDLSRENIENMQDNKLLIGMFSRKIVKP